MRNIRATKGASLMEKAAAVRNHVRVLNVCMVSIHDTVGVFNTAGVSVAGIVLFAHEDKGIGNSGL